MALTKLPKNAIGTGSVKANNIADGTIQNTDISGSIGADQLSSTLDLSSTSVTFANNEISNAELTNSSFTLNGSSVSLGGSTSIIPYLDWQAVQVADGSTQVNAEVNKGYFLDTNAGVIEVFLPSSPTRGDVVALVDYSGTFGTNQIIINTGGVNIDSTVGSEFKVTTNNAIVELVYVDSSKGWLVNLNQAAGTTPSSALTGYSSSYDNAEPLIEATGGTVTEAGAFKIHTFTGDGCFSISSISPNSPGSVDYLVVAGGGSGNNGGGAGAGGYRESHSVPVSGCYTASPLATPTSLPVTATSYPITVGGGGTGGSPAGSAGDGNNSSFSTITSTGGGAGGYTQYPPGPIGDGRPGGSGGGASNDRQSGATGSGNTPPTSPPQGQPGGTAPGYFFQTAAGGGGATQAGQPGPLAQYGAAGDGGNGAGTGINPSSCVGTPGPCGSIRYFAGGGGGNQRTDPTPSYPYEFLQGSGGIGGGGDRNVAGTANTGGGGGSSAAGGKGIVIIRYKYTL